MHPDAPARARFLRPALLALGVGLAAAAIWAVARQHTAVAAMLAAARAAPAWMSSALAASLAVNWFLTSVVFWTLTVRLGPVRLPEMLRLTGAAWLLNYLPARPGLAGRLAFHRLVHGIPLKDSALVVAWSIASTGLAAAAMLAAITLAGPPAAIALTLAGLLAGPLLTLRAVRHGRRGSLVNALAAALAWRLVEMANWSLRYALVFALVGHPVAADQAVLFAAAAQAASFVPVPLGLREWTVAALAPDATVGLAADLLNRGGEIVMALLVGGLSARRLARDLRHARPPGPAGPPRPI